MALKTVKVPKDMAPLFEKAEKVVSSYFKQKREDPSKGTIEIHDQRYVLVRGASLSVEFFELVKGYFGRERENEARKFALNLLFDLSHAIGKADAKNFHESMDLEDPIAKLSAGPVHFSHSGWAFVDISPESRPTPDENYYLIYDHPYTFESDAWIKSGKKSDFPVCVMNAGYSSGWCEESFGVNLVASEILCRAKGDDCCRFIMAPSHRIGEYVERYIKERPELGGRVKGYEIPDLFARKKLEEDLRQKEWTLRERVKELDCLYGLARVVEDPGVGVEEMLKATVELIPPAFFHPEKTCASITYGDKQFRTVRCEGPVTAGLTSEIKVDGEIVGSIDVGLHGKSADHEEWPFLDEEQKLLDALSERIGRIIERVEATEELARVKDELEDKNARLEEMDRVRSDFVAYVAHELRGPMATVMGGLKLMTDNVYGPVNDKQRHALDIANSNIERLVRIVNNLLDLSKIEAGKFEIHKERIDLSILVQQLVASEGPRAKGKGLALAADVPEQAVEVDADPDAMTQVLTNLVGNAIKFTDKGGVTVTLQDGEDSVELAVSDTGIGMEEDQLSTIFDKYKQVGMKDSKRGKGTGLGLSIARGIVAAHGGELSVRSTPGKGTMFYFSLPKA